MEISLVRKDSLGIEGTYRNAKHHAQNLIPFVEYLEREVTTFGFAEWQQGHNVHIFHTEDGRRFDLTPYPGYQGILLRARVSRSYSIPIAIVTKMSELPAFCSMLRVLANPLPKAPVEASRSVAETY